MPPEITWKLGLGLGYGSQAEREFSWYLKGPLKACEMALTLKTHTAEAAMLFLGSQGRESGRVRGPAATAALPTALRTTQSLHLLQKLKVTGS